MPANIETVFLLFKKFFVIENSIVIFMAEE